MFWELTDHLFRFGAICSLSWIVFLSATKHSKLADPYITIPTMVSAMCYLIVGAYDEVALFGWFGYVMGFVARLTLVLNWLFTIYVFSDNFRLSPFYITVLTIYLIRALIFQLDIVPYEVMAVFSHSLRFGLYVFLMYKLFSEMAGDLLEKRRKYRVWLMVGHILLTIALTLERKFIRGDLYADYSSLIESGGIFLIATFLLSLSIRSEESSPFESGNHNSPVVVSVCLPPEKESDLPAADRHNLELLEHKMKAGLYREPGLTAAKLAVALGIQEHRLRRLINIHLGYRNISQYLNDYRIDEAKRRLADVGQRNVRVLSIAMEAGYVSLRPFNRAFKDRTGLTPTEFREKHLRDQPYRLQSTCNDQRAGRGT